MADHKKQLGVFGLLLLFYSALRETMSAMGLIEELKEVIGPVSEEGVTILLTVAGLALITPVLVRLSGKIWNSWWVPRRERRARIKKAEEVLPLLDHLTFAYINELASPGRWRGVGNPDPLFLETVHSPDPYSSKGRLYQIRAEVAHLVEEEAARRKTTLP